MRYEASVTSYQKKTKHSQNRNRQKSYKKHGSDIFAPFFLIETSAMGSQTKAAARRISGIAKDALQIRTETLRWESTKSTMQPPFPSFFFLTQKAESKASDRSPTLSRRRRRSSSYILYSLPFSLINVPSHVLIYVPSFPFVRVFSARHFPAPRLHSKRASERACARERAHHHSPEKEEEEAKKLIRSAVRRCQAGDKTRWAKRRKHEAAAAAAERWRSPESRG